MSGRIHKSVQCCLYSRVYKTFLGKYNLFDLLLCVSILVSRLSLFHSSIDVYGADYDNYGWGFNPTASTTFRGRGLPQGLDQARAIIRY